MGVFQSATECKEWKGSSGNLRDGWCGRVTREKIISREEVRVVLEKIIL